MDHVIETQKPVFALLADPATHGGAAVKRFDTHAAAVFLAGERAFKVKRAVRFPFLDFSTLEKRKAACAAEIEVNQPFAPDLYRGLVAITRAADGGLELDGRGTAVEWAVEMRRFDETRTLDRLAEAARIDAALADALGRVVAAAHARAPVAEAAPWIAAFGAYIDEHAAAFGERPDLFAPAQAAALEQANRAAHDRVRPLLVERGRRALVRRIHGDLHLGNIALIDGAPVPFDAIEFSALIGSGDVLYDLAFLLMDLVERGLGAPANIVFNRYFAQAQRPEDLEALAALPLFLSMRAAIRAKVTAARLDRAEEAAQPAIRRDAKKYFDWACRLIAPAPPRLIAVGGLSGTGKSVLARALACELAPAPGALLLRSDVVRKTLLGAAEETRLPPEAYGEAMTLQVFATLADRARRALAAGHSVIVDAVYATPDQRAIVEKSAAVLGVAFRGLFLDADLATRSARIERRGADASDADAAIARQQEHYNVALSGWPRIDASGTPEETLARARAALT
jgi:aminoglycoside phosphotransferase family enzyme/predicted kinase